VDGLRVEIYTWITLNPGDSWTIFLTARVLDHHTDNTTNFACIYLNWDLVDCDDATHTTTKNLVCKKPNIVTEKFNSGWWSTKVTCEVDPSWENADIEINCGNWAKYMHIKI
jgi:hypothetical protein